MRAVGLSPTDVSNIIKACAASKVSKLEFANLKVEFSQGPDSQPMPSSNYVIPEAKAVQEGEAQALEQAEVESKVDQLSTMLLTDPVGYERLMIEGDLKEGLSGYGE